MKGVVMPGRISDMDKYSVDYRLNQLGIRVSGHTCQLISRIGKNWHPLGPRWQLPISVPADVEDLGLAMTLSVTAWQFCEAYPDTDLMDVLTGRARSRHCGIYGDTRPQTLAPRPDARPPRHPGADPVAASRDLIRTSRERMEAQGKEMA
jgi:hypothetical protein